MKWTGRIVIGDLVVEINLCGDHFQEFMDKWEENFDE